METNEGNGAARSKMKVEVWSDIMCPFCYIGKRHYEEALKDFSGAGEVEIEWKSFQLDPNIPETVEPGTTSAEYLATSKGINSQQVKSMHHQVQSMAEEAGLQYNLEATKLFNSFKAHRIIQLAKTKGKGDAAEDLFFKAHFTDNKDLGNEAVLMELAAEIGIPAEAAQEALSNTLYADKVKEDIYEAQQVGVRGVPFFVFDNKYAVSGAQPVEAFTQVLQRAFSEWEQDAQNT